MAKRDIQVARMIQYFIDATVQIIDEEGIDNVTIRKIAKPILPDSTVPPSTITSKNFPILTFLQLFGI